MPVHPAFAPPAASRRITCLTLVSVVLLSGAGAARADAATVRGTVVDPDGRPAPAARILLLGPAGATDTAVADAQGAFAFAGLPAGRHELRVTLEGFRADPIALVLAAGDDRQVRIALRISAVTEWLVVSAAQIDQPLARTPASVTVLGAAELAARGLDTVGDALRLVPGMSVAQSGGRGALTSVFPRGGESDFTLVLVDGIRLNAFGGGHDFAHLPIAEIDRIEIVRGPQSALFGSDAIGGVVQIVTRHGGPPRAGVTLEAGSFGTTRGAGHAAGARGPWRWGLAAERLATDGFTGLAPATGEQVTNDDYTLGAISASAGWRSVSGTEIRGDARVSASDRGFPGPFGSDPGGTFGGVDRVARGETTTRAWSLGITHAWTPRLRHRTQIAAADVDGAFDSRFGRSESGTRRVSLRSQLDFSPHDTFGLTAGVEYTGERAHSTFITGGTPAPVPVRRRSAGYFVEGRTETGDRLFAAAGLRVEQIRRLPLEADPFAFQPRPPFGADRIVSANPKVALSWFLQPSERRARAWTRLRASAGAGIRPPDAFEIAFTDNPGLRPERSRSAEAGVEQALAGGAFAAELTAFYNAYDDLIVAVGPSLRDASRYRTDNISNARTRGLEAAIAGRTSWGLDARAAWTWLDTAILAVDGARDLAPPPFSAGDALVRRPRHAASLDLLITRSRLSAHARIGGRGRMPDIDPSFGASGGLFHAPGYATVAAGGSVRLARAAEVYVRVTNLFDRLYEETLGFPAPGRRATVGVRLAAGR